MRSQSRAEVSSVRDFWFVRLMQKERWHAPPFYKYKHFINHDLVNHDFLLIGDIYTFGKFYCFVAGYFYLFNQCAGDVVDIHIDRFFGIDDYSSLHSVYSCIVSG